MNLNKYCVAAIAASFSSSAFAFTPTSTSSRKFGVSHKTTSLQSHSNKNNENMFNEAKSALTSAALAGLLWVSPMVATVGLNYDVVGNNNNMLLENIRTSVVSDAKEMASASGSRVNKDADSLLRYGLPINNKEVSFVLESEEIYKNDSVCLTRNYHFVLFHHKIHLCLIS